MTTSNVINELRTRPGLLALGADAQGAITLRVQMQELWDTIAVKCAPDTSVLALKKAALEAFDLRSHPAHEYVLKLRGFEVLDENAPVTVAGAREGSTFLLAYRYRRPVR